jgi:hypothetical protein
MDEGDELASFLLTSLSMSYSSYKVFVKLRYLTFLKLKILCKTSDIFFLVIS